MSIEVISKRYGGYKGENLDIVIDISRTSPVGNPFPVATFGRSGCIGKFAGSWNAMMQNKVFANYIDKIVDLHIEGKHIGLECWCAKLSCHGDVIKQKAEQMANFKLGMPAQEEHHGIPFGDDIADHTP